MKATFTVLAALMVSTYTWTAASAQDPSPVMPAGHASVSVPAAGGCASCGGTTAGCESGTNCGSHGLLHKLGLKKGSACATGSCQKQGGCNGDGCGSGNGGICASIKNWICRPCPSNAPRIGKPDYPLGFPTQPYARGPRDFFMMD